MDYNEQKADEIIQKFSLNPSTKKTWQHRNKIPDKYRDTDHTPTIEPSKAELIIQKRIVEILEMGLININVLFDLADVYYQKYQDVRRGKTTSFSKQEIIRLKKEILRIRILITKTFERRSEVALRELLKTEVLLIRPIMARNQASMIDYDRASRFRRKSYALEDDDYNLIKDCYIKAAMALSL